MKNELRRTRSFWQGPMRKAVKIICLILVLSLLTVMVTACGNDDDDQGSGKKKRNQDKENVVPSENNPTGGIINPLKHDFSKLENLEVGDTCVLGVYEQDGNESNGKEDIEWIVIAKEYDSYLLLSKYVLDCKSYNEEFEKVTWETCTLREWLNGDFLKIAFDSEELELIKKSTVSADKNPQYDTDPGNDTEDRVFLLSVKEINQYPYDYHGIPTNYAHNNGAYIYDEEGHCCWYLRSPGDISQCAAEISSLGEVGGAEVSDFGTGVRPSIRIKRTPDGSSEPEPTQAVDKEETFERSSDWDQYKPEDLAIQIDDTIYKPGVKVSDFIELLEKSKVEYTYEYNPDKLVMYGSTETIKIYRSGEKDIWFTVSAVNIFEETKALSDLPIVEIKPTGAMKSSYYISGIHYNDFIGMKYVDLKDYFKTLLPSYVYSDYEYKTGGWTSVEGIPNGSNVIEVIVESWDSVRIYSYWCGYSFSSYAKYILYVDPETGKVIKFLPSYYPGFLTPEKIGE